MKAISRKEWTYVLEEDRTRPIEEQSVFHFRPLSRGTWRAIADGGGPELKINFGGAAGERILKECLFAWEAVPNPDTGEPIPFPEKIDAALDLLPGVTRIELALEVWNRASLSETARKN